MKLSTLFLSSGFGSLSGKALDKPQFPYSSRCLLNTSCKMRPRRLRCRFPSPLLTYSCFFTDLDVCNLLDAGLDFLLILTGFLIFIIVLLANLHLFAFLVYLKVLNLVFNLLCYLILFLAFLFHSLSESNQLDKSPLNVFVIIFFCNCGFHKSSLFSLNEANHNEYHIEKTTEWFPIYY